MNAWRIILFAVSSACFGSFAWAIRHHFTRPKGARMSNPMRLLSLLGAALVMMQLLAIAQAARFSWLGSMAALALYLASIGLFWWTVRVTRSQRFSLAFSGEAPSQLLTAGPYRWIRHPFYTAYAFFWIAGVVATNRWWLVPFVIVVLSFYLRAARREEAEFNATDLRTSYRHYHAATGMFLPRLKSKSDAS